MPDLTNDAGTIADLALATGNHIPLTDGTHTLVVPHDASLVLVDAEGLQSAPTRPRGTVNPGTVEAFVDYCATHDAEGTEVWVSTEQIIAVLNGITDDAQGWGDHRAVLTLKHTPEWQHWTKLDGQMVGQAQFAEHIEEGLIDIVEPDSAEMLEVAKHFQVTRDAQFRSSQHLESGRIGFGYDESDTAKAGKSGDFEIPKQFVLGIPVYDGEESYKIIARFRYRLNEGNLTLGYKLERPDLVKRDAAQQIAERLRVDEAPFAQVYDGVPGDAVRAALPATVLAR